MISILTNPTEQNFKDIESLLAQLHGDSASSYSPTLSNLATLTAGQNGYVIVSSDDEKIVGMAILYVHQGIDQITGHVDDVVVDEAHRGKGIATQLMNEVISLAKEKNLRQVELTSRPSREAANHLYQKLGFEKRETNPYRLKLQ